MQLHRQRSREPLQIFNAFHEASSEPHGYESLRHRQRVGGRLGSNASEPGHGNRYQRVPEPGGSAVYMEPHPTWAPYACPRLRTVRTDATRNARAWQGPTRTPGAPVREGRSADLMFTMQARRTWLATPNNWGTLGAPTAKDPARHSIRAQKSSWVGCHLPVPSLGSQGRNCRDGKARVNGPSALPHPGRLKRGFQKARPGLAGADVCRPAICLDWPDEAELGDLSLTWVSETRRRKDHP